MAQTTTTLPDGYQLYFEMDLQKDRKLALRVNGLALLLAAVLLVLGLLWHSWREWMNTDHFFLRSIVLIVGMIGYLFLHEWVHGIFMKHFSGVKAQYGFTGLYACAGSGAYFNRKQYIIIAMAPVVIWGAVLLACMLAVPATWFWVVYLIQIGNLSGAAGDFYVAWNMQKMPEEILIQDSGVSMRVYAREPKP